MIFLYIFLGIILLLGAILALRGTVTIEYRDELKVSLCVLFVKIKLLPKKEKREKRSMTKKQSERLRLQLLKKKEKKKQKKLEKKRAKEEKKKTSKKKTLSEMLSDIGEIANHLFVSESYLFRLFKRELHQTPKKYIREKRLLMAQKMLSEGEKPSRVSECCGFSDYTTFYRNYTAFFGRSPRDIRSEENQVP